jgi:hypothetical protein
MRIKVWIALPALGLVAGCSNDDAARAPTGVPVIVDSDLAAERLISILYLVEQEDLDVGRSPSAEPDWFIVRQE